MEFVIKRDRRRQRAGLERIAQAFGLTNGTFGDIILARSENP